MLNSQMWWDESVPFLGKHSLLMIMDEVLTALEVVDSIQEAVLFTETETDISIYYLMYIDMQTSIRA